MNPELDIKRLERNQKIIFIVNRVILYTFLTLMAIIVIIPFYWMVITGVKTVDEVESFPPTIFPKTIMLSNYVEAMRIGQFGRYFLNTVIVGVISTILTIVTTVFASFAFSRLNFKGKEVAFFILLATMMLPGEMMVLPNYITVSRLGWIDRYEALIIPFIVSVFYIYLLNQNFKQIPNELYYAAKVDGTSDFKYLIRVMIPLAKPTIISIAILKMMGSWNAFIWPNLVADKESMRLITNGLRKAFTDTLNGRSSYNLQMAATLVVTLPLLFVFIFFRQYIMKGVSRSGIKG